MQTFLTLLIFTFAYGLLFLSFFPERSRSKISKLTVTAKKAMYRDGLAWPFFLSFLGGYIVASLIVYFIRDSI